MITCHTPAVGSTYVTEWNPWRVLRRREHLRLQYAYLHPSRGRIVEHPDGLRTITLDRRLDQVQRNATLSHELVHDELDLLWCPGLPPAVEQKVEHLVERISDERLLPATDLAAFVEEHRGQMVVSWMVAEEFEVPTDVASRCLDRLASGF